MGDISHFDGLVVSRDLPLTFRPREDVNVGSDDGSSDEYTRELSLKRGRRIMMILNFLHNISMQIIIYNIIIIYTWLMFVVHVLTTCIICIFSNFCLITLYHALLTLITMVDYCY